MAKERVSNGGKKVNRITECTCCLANWITRCLKRTLDDEKKVDNLILKCSDVKPKKLLILMRLCMDSAVDSAVRHSKVAIYFMGTYSGWARSKHKFECEKCFWFFWFAIACSWKWTLSNVHSLWLLSVKILFIYQKISSRPAHFRTIRFFYLPYLDLLFFTLIT